MKTNIYKGWDEETKEMLEHQDLSAPRDSLSWLGKKDVKLIQYSGTKDHLGNRVFEGDIIKFSFGIPPICVIAPIVFLKGGFFALTPKAHPKMCLLGELKSCVGEFEVIGNIFENPKLLEG